jgi:nucleotide-binding universal stress UspA family protein
MHDRPPLDTILVATDFSPDSHAAIDWATSLARAHRAKLVLAHSVMTATPPAPEFVSLDPPFREQLRADASERLDAIAAGLRANGLATEIALTDAPVATGLIELAHRCRADVLVAGTRGRTGWKRVVLGSVSARLVRKARCPVVTVHAEHAHRHGPVRTILVPTDFSDDALVAAHAASRLFGEAGDAHRLVLLHVYRYPLVLTEGSTPVLSRSGEEVVASARREMLALAERFCRDGIEVDARVDEGLPPRVILDQAQQIGADLIAMGTHGRSGLDRLLLGSTAERVLSSAPCPVLTMHRP